MKKIVALAFVAALLAGCASTPDEQTAQIKAACYAAASIGTQMAIASNPQYRPAFELAYNNLGQLIEKKIVTGFLLRGILESLPVKELKSDNARIAIEGATFLFDTFAGDRINLESNPTVLAAAQGIYAGMGVALNKSP